jgi:DNA polymerase alpha-associated DNA helicase A
MNQTMQRLQKMQSDEYSIFVRVLFGLTSPSPVSGEPVEGKDLEWHDPSLNDSQKDAIRFALDSKEVALIHGPPGVSDAFLSMISSMLDFEV